MANHALYISAKTAANVDKMLMGPGGFSIDQLMELAGQAVAHACYKVHPPSRGKQVLVLVGPGNNGGDGLVASRHLSLYGYKPTIYCPKRSNGVLYERLHTQLINLKTPYVATADISAAFAAADIIIDALFGFSFKPPVRPSFQPVMDLLCKTDKEVLSVDVPSSWDVDEGPKGSTFNPQYLISLTAPKSCAKAFKGRHFIGGRFIDAEFAKQFGFEIPPYEGVAAIWEEPRGV